MRFIRRAGAHADKSPKGLHVEPAELARKLVKEMEDHKVSRSDGVWVSDRYTIFLCPEDFEGLKPRESQLLADLAGKLAKYAADMKYRLRGELAIEIVRDPDLELGYFGILAQRVSPQREPSVAASAQVAAPPVAGTPAVAFEPPASEPAAAAAAPVPAPEKVAVAGAESAAAAAAAPGAAAVAAPAAAAAAAPLASELDIPASTRVIPAEEAQELGLARRVIVVRSGDQVREFSQSRVVLGRGRDADFRVDDPNVSRKHAALYWSEGKLLLDDLGSTNGTMVNGYPITSTVIRPQDVIAMGSSQVTVEAK